MVSVIYTGIAWLIYLIIQALFINGVKLSAAGTTEVRPDGTDYDSEMLLYPLAKELLKKTTCKIFYTGDQLKALYDYLAKNVPEFANMTVVATNLFYSSDGQRVFAKRPESIAYYSRYLSEGCLIEFDDNGMAFYKTYDQFKYSKWIRKPIIQCIVCMASFYGLLLFLVPLLIITHFNLLVLPAYVVNTFMLACMNKIIFNISK